MCLFSYLCIPPSLFLYICFLSFYLFGSFRCKARSCLFVVRTFNLYSYSLCISDHLVASYDVCIFETYLSPGHESFKALRGKYLPVCTGVEKILAVYIEIARKGDLSSTKFRSLRMSLSYKCFHRICWQFRREESQGRGNA